MKLDCVRPRHRKLSPDGRWTDMEFESAENGKAGIYRKKRGGRGEGEKERVNGRKKMLGEEQKIG